jgi:two-component system, sensor histidine kinase YesM
MAYKGSFRETMRASIFWFILLAFLAVVIPLYVMGTGLIQWGRTEVQKEMEQSMLSDGSYYADSLERELISINQSKESVLTSLNMRRLGVMSQNISDWDRVSAILYLQERFATIKESSAYIEDITAYIPSIGLRISSLHGVDSIDESTYKEEVKQFTPGERSFLYYAKEAAAGANSPGSLYMVSGFPLVQYRMKHFGEPPADPSYLLVVKLSSPAVNGMLGRLASTKEGSAFLVHSQSGMIFTTGDAASDKSMLDSLKDKSDARSGIFNWSGKGGAVIGMYRELPSKDLKLYFYAPQSAVYRQVNNYRDWLLVFVLSSVAIIAVFSTLIYTRVHVPLRMLVQAFGRMAGGDMKVRITHRQRDEFRYLYTRFNDMAMQLEGLIEQDYKQRILIQQAQLKQLQSRINPHFLFNSFFTLSTMARTGDSEGVAEFSDYLGEYFRFITRLDSDTDLLSEEVSHAKAFAQIQMTRFSNRIEMSFEELPQEVASMRVPRLIVQPLLENSFEYGFNHVVSGGRIQVRYQKDGDGLHIIVEDNGQGVDEEAWERLQHAFEGEDVEATGLVNIHKRIQLYFGAGGIRLERRAGGGLRVELVIPWERREDNA